MYVPFLVFLCLIIFKPAPGVILGLWTVNVIALMVLVILGLYLSYIYITSRGPLEKYGLFLARWKENPIFIYLLLSSISLTISTVYGMFVSPTLTSIEDLIELHRYAFYLLFFMLAYTIGIDHIKKMILPVVVIIFIVELFGVIQFFNLFNVNNHIGLFYTISERHYNMIIRQQRIPSFFLNPNMYGSFLVIVVGLVLSYLTFAKSIKKRITIPLLILTFISVFFTTSRTAVITVAGMIVYWTIYSLFFHRKEIKRTVVVGLATLVLYIALALILIPQIKYLDYAADQIFDNMASLNEEDADVGQPKIKFKESIGNIRSSVDSVNSFHNRYEYWTMNVEKWKESPILGQGPMKSGEFVGFADNSYLFILARYGLVGLLIFAAFYVYLYVKTTVTVTQTLSSDSKKMLAMAINLIIVGYLVMGMVSEVWFNLQSMTIFFMMIGLYYNKHIQ
jgi:O-antigen ligase